MIYYIGLVSVLANFLAGVLACDDISGRWYNQLGSEVDINHLTHGVLEGKYYTRVSRSGEQLKGHDLVGTLPYNKPGASFAFSVTWSGGAATTIWTGQCQVCEGKEILETSWLLRYFVDSCLDKWKSTLIGKDIFYRKPTSGKKKRAVSDSKPNIMKDENYLEQCNLQGIWYNDLGSEIILNQTKLGVITGEYRTAVEKEKGSAGSTHSLVYGSGAHGNPNSTFSLLVVWREGESATGWVGQCHVCGANKTVVLEMSWLLRSKVDNCDDVWKSTMYGVSSFTRHEQKPGPRKSSGKHTPNRDGEDDDVGGTSSRVVPPVVLWCFAILFVSANNMAWSII